MEWQKVGSMVQQRVLSGVGERGLDGVGESGCVNLPAYPYKLSPAWAMKIIAVLGTESSI